MLLRFIFGIQLQVSRNNEIQQNAEKRAIMLQPKLPAKQKQEPSQSEQLRDQQECADHTVNAQKRADGVLLAAEEQANENVTAQKEPPEVLLAAQRTAQQLLTEAQKQAADLLLSAAKQQAELLLSTVAQRADSVLVGQRRADISSLDAQESRSKQRANPSELEALLAQKLQAEILDLTHDAVILRDLDGTIRYWNRGAQNTYGFNSQEAIGQKLTVLLQSEFPKPEKEIYRELNETGRWDGQVIRSAQSKAKLVIAVRWVLKAGSEKTASSILEISSDITVQAHAKDLLLAAQQQAQIVLIASQKQAQIVLMAAQQTRSDQRLSLVVEAAPNAIVMVDESDNVTLVNSQMENLFGYSREELLGNSIKVLAPDAASDKSLGPASFFLDPAAKTTSKGDFWGRHKNGTLIPVEIGLTPLIIDSDQFILASIVDITERNRYEELLKANIDKLAASNEELEQFAYVCSHDLQEPLRVIANYTRLLAKRYEGKLDAKADQFIGFTIDASKRMQDLINDLLTFSRLKNAQVISKVDCSSVLEMAIANLKLAVDDAGATVKYGTLPVVNGDTSQLLQLFQNLIGNALKFRSPDTPCVIDISVRKEGELWLFAVHDNGLGIDMQFADRIFLMFQRLHVKEKYPGSGIGLTICKAIVQRHGGRIWLESTPGEGATFYFTIPTTTE